MNTSIRGWLAAFLLLYSCHFAAAGEPPLEVKYAKQLDEATRKLDSATDPWGAPEELTYRPGAKIPPSVPPGIHCTGFTFNVAVKTLMERKVYPTDDEMNGKKAANKDVKGIRERWHTKADPAYGALVNSTLGAAQGGKLGTKISEGNVLGAKPGDFAFFLWNKYDPYRGAGHSVVISGFLPDTETADANTYAVKYFSAQANRQIVGEQTEYFADHEANTATIDPSSFRVARLYSPPPPAAPAQPAAPVQPPPPAPPPQ